MRHQFYFNFIFLSYLFKWVQNCLCNLVWMWNKMNKVQVPCISHLSFSPGNSLVCVHSKIKYHSTKKVFFFFLMNDDFKNIVTVEVEDWALHLLSASSHFESSSSSSSWDFQTCLHCQAGKGSLWTDVHVFYLCFLWLLFMYYLKKQLIFIFYKL